MKDMPGQKNVRKAVKANSKDAGEQATMDLGKMDEIATLILRTLSL